MASWIPIEGESPFSLSNIPFGIITNKSNTTPRPAVAIGHYALDLQTFADGKGFSALPTITDHLDVFNRRTLNDFAALGRPVHRTVRSYLQEIFAENTKHPELLKENDTLRERALVPLDEVQTHVPLAIGDYTDFYAGRHHAYNVGVLFRGPANALQPNYDYLPVAYHGRSSSVVTSGTPINRPWGQILRDPAVKVPVLAPCEKLDYEVELAAFICKENALGEPVSIKEADDHIFGYTLMIDWSARDIQAWEYVPLGPFTSKNLGTSISPWVVLADALEPFKASGISLDKPLLEYLREEKENNMLNIELEVDLITAQGHKTTLAKTNSRHLLWSYPQMIAHHTITGCNLRTGDLLGSGTISGLSTGTEGSLLEQTQNGKIPLELENGEKRLFLEDGDTLVIRGKAGSGAGLVSFGEVFGRIDPPKPLPFTKP